MKITRFKKIKKHRIFCDFHWPEENVLPNFGKYNLIYGWNGVGKTTLSNIFRHVERRSPILEGEISLLLENDVTVMGTELGNFNLPQTRVFNRDFIDRSIFEQTEQKLPPIYYLGEDSAEAQNQVKSLKVQSNALIVESAQIIKDLSSAKSTFEKYCTDQARSVKNLLTATGSTYNNYNAANFKITSELLSKKPIIDYLSTADREKNEIIVKSMSKDLIDRPTQSYPDFNILTKKVSDLTQRSIVSSVIVELRDNPSVAKWVNEGLLLHNETQNRSTCYFCNQPLLLERIVQLEGHFNDSYSKFQMELDELIEEINKYVNLVSKTELPPQALLYENLKNTYSEQVDVFKFKSTQVSYYLNILKSALIAKQKEPFKNFNLDVYFTEPPTELTWKTGLISLFQIFSTAVTGAAVASGKSAFDSACDIIDQHNQITSNFNAKQIQARRLLEFDEVARALDSYISQAEKIISLEYLKEQNKNNEDELLTKITEIERSIRQHQPAAEELTQDMAAYLGRAELEFLAQDTGYEIRRHGEAAMHLSEGERTAVAFIYFLKTLQDSSFDIENGVIVIDDPVSSLDANSLYSAFGFMKSRIQRAEQVFILTHNFTFFRQVKNWFNHVENFRNRQPDLINLKNVRFYALKSISTENGRSSNLCVLDELLHKYESEYHHMFQMVIDAGQEPENLPMERFYPLPNITRRLLEAFLAFKQPEKTGELFQQLKDIKFDETKKARIIRFTNTYSHHGLMPEPIHDLSVLSESPYVAQDVLSLILSLDESHHRSMHLLCNRN